MCLYGIGGPRLAGQAPCCRKTQPTYPGSPGNAAIDRLGPTPQTNCNRMDQIVCKCGKGSQIASRPKAAIPLKRMQHHGTAHPAATEQPQPAAGQGQKPKARHRPGQVGPDMGGAVDPGQPCARHAPGRDRPAIAGGGI